MLPSSTVQILQVNGKPSGLQMPASVELAVAETEPGVKGDTVSNVTKPATLETGAVVQVPLFVESASGSRSIPARPATSRAPDVPAAGTPAGRRGSEAAGQRR